jgi:DNA primase large subunit
MEVSSSVRSGSQGKHGSHSNRAVPLVSLYYEVPTEEVSLDEFEEFALDRLQLLRSVELFKSRGLEETKLYEKIIETEKKFMPLASSGADDSEENRRKDIISHFIMRLAYCRTDELRRWFLLHEVILFKARLQKLTQRQRADLMAANNLEYEAVTDEEKFSRQDKLEGLLGVKVANILRDRYYRVPFVQALSLLRSRNVYCEKGFAFVPLSHLEDVIITRFRVSLNKSMTIASNFFHSSAATGDSRIAGLLQNLDKLYVDKTFNSNEGTSLEVLKWEEVPMAAQNHMPLCMKAMQTKLEATHRLKYSGRMQYGLFLKAAGLSLEDALKFFEMHFSKVMPHDKFAKEYAYGIRHNYGKEGARKNYTAQSCRRIIQGPSPGPDETHGCPYKHSTESELAAQLTSLKLGPAVVREVILLAKGQSKFQPACRRVFDVTHPEHLSLRGPEGQVVGDDVYSDHPNKYYNASIMYSKIKTGNLGASTTAAAADPVPEKVENVE